jgi:protein-S-isoprenylcysteine O-methyltransferase Ste14
METALRALRAAIYGSGFVLLWGWLSFYVERRYDGGLGVSIPAGAVVPGAVLMLAGFALVVACVGQFVVAGRGTAAPFDPPRVLVPSGPYRYVRNPMYIGAGMTIAGFGLVRRSASIVLLSLAMLLAAHLFVVLVEEPGLRRRFGQRYDAYRASTRRWLPRLPKRPS